MSAMEKYYEVLLGQMRTIREREWAKIAQAGEWLGEALVNEKFLYAFGTGHSHLLAEEIFYRAGGLARACPILDDRLMLHKEAIEATYIEREEGYAAKLLDLYPVEHGDVLIVASNSGRNAVPIEMALKRGVMTEVFISSNSNGDDHNDRLLQKYKSRVRHL